MQTRWYCPKSEVIVLIEFATVLICCRNRGAFKSHRPRSQSLDGCVRGGAMDGSLLIGAPIGLGVLLAAGIVMVVMSYLTQ